MRIAIACCGLEHVLRGYESFARELFEALSGSTHVVLFKGSGPRRPREIVVPCLRRHFLARIMSAERAFYWEQVSFALALVPLLALMRIDLVHFSEGNLGNALARFLRWTGSGVRMVQSNGAPYHPRDLRPEAYIHQVSKQAFDEALGFGIPPGRMTLIPHGIAPSSFRARQDKATLRRSLGLPVDSIVILSLAALNISHKRLDYAIREISALAADSVFLVMAGEPTPETAALNALAARLLCGRHLFLTVPRQKVPDLLAAADVLVHTALHEGFGMVLIEAAAAGVPVLCHHSAHFRGILGDAALFTDMAQPGTLAERLLQAIHHPEALADIIQRGKARVETLYNWQVLAPRYIEMYKAALNLTPAIERRQ